MARIRIHFSDVQSANTELKKTLQAMERLEEQLSALQQQVAPEIQSRYGISARLRSCRNAASSLADRARRLHSVAEAGVRKYRETEARLCRGAPNDGTGTM